MALRIVSRFFACLPGPWKTKKAPGVAVLALRGASCQATNIQWTSCAPDSRDVVVAMCRQMPSPAILPFVHELPSGVMEDVADSQPETRCDRGTNTTTYHGNGLQSISLAQGAATATRQGICNFSPIRQQGGLPGTQVLTSSRVLQN